MTPPGPQAGLRDILAAGLGARGEAAAGEIEAWTTFLVADDAGALRAWFGDDALSTASAASLRHAIDRDVLALDALIAVQLDAILHHPRLQALEARWRGLWWLLDQVEDGPGDRIVVRVLNASWAEVERDMARADDGQSHIAGLVHDSAFGTAGGEPIGLLIVDHAVRHRPDAADPIDDPVVLGYLAEIAAVSFAPILTAAAPELLGVGDFGELARTARPADVLGGPEHRRWHDLARHENARFLGVVAPRVLGRAAWRDEGTSAGGFRYAERIARPSDRLWMNGAYAFAAVVARASARFGWPADIRGADPDRVGGGVVLGLPPEPHRLSATLAYPRLPVEIAFTAGQERSLAAAGLIPLGALPHGDMPMFSSLRSLHRAGSTGQTGAALGDAMVATQLNSLLCAARFVHHLKVIGRQAVGAVRTAQQVEQELTAWLTRFVNRNTEAPPATRAAFPLFDAAVQVTEQPDKPGSFDCAIDLQPYFQLDNVLASFRFATRIGPHAS